MKVLALIDMLWRTGFQETHFDTVFIHARHTDALITCPISSILDGG